VKSVISAGIIYDYIITGTLARPFKWEQVGGTAPRPAGAFFVSNWKRLASGDGLEWLEADEAKSYWLALLDHYTEGVPLPPQIYPGVTEEFPLTFAVPTIALTASGRRRTAWVFRTKTALGDGSALSTKGLPDIAHASLVFGAFAGQVVRCLECGTPVLKDPKHPWVVQCGTCRRRRGRPRAAWLPDSLRDDWTRLVNRLNQQATRGQCTRVARNRALVAARRDAERVAQGKEPSTAWIARWGSRKQQGTTYKDPDHLAGIRLAGAGRRGRSHDGRV